MVSVGWFKFSITVWQINIRSSSCHCICYLWWHCFCLCWSTGEITVDMLREWNQFTLLLSFCCNIYDLCWALTWIIWTWLIPSCLKEVSSTCIYLAGNNRVSVSRICCWTWGVRCCQRNGASMLLWYPFRQSLILSVRFFMCSFAYMTSSSRWELWIWSCLKWFLRNFCVFLIAFLIAHKFYFLLVWAFGATCK